MIKLSTIKLNETNPRSIKEDKFKKLVKSIKESTKFLEARPIVVKDSIVYGGNMRLRALQEPGYTEVPNEWIKDVSGWTAEDIHKFIVVDNIAYGDNDWDLLSEQYEKEELEEWGMDVDKWVDDEVVEDEVPEVTENPVSKLGEVYQLGRHRLMAGDSTKIEDVEKLMDWKKASVGITDPPYGVRKEEAWDKESLFLESINDWYTNFKTFCESGLVWFCADKMLEPLVKLGNFERLLVWNKPAGSQFAGASNNNLWYSNEPILVYDFGSIKKNCGTNEYAYSVFESRTIPKDKEGHPTTKPIDLMSWLINHYSKEEQIVLDLFLGSGSTLIACEQTNRICYGMEISEAYCDVIRKRYAKFIGKEEEWQTITPVLK